MHFRFGDGARIERKSPCGSQFSFASVTCARDASIAAAFAFNPGLPRAISSSCCSVIFLACAEGIAATVMTPRRSTEER